MPKITDEHIKQINELLMQNPDWNRSKLSIELCKKWGWESSIGQLKDIRCRALLSKLDRTGQIKLPAPQNITRQIGGGADKVKLIEYCTDQIETSLCNLTPLIIEIVKSKEELETFKSYIAQFHYLGYDRSIGENMKYMIKSQAGIPLACMMYSSAAWKCKPRDEFIGWSSSEREKGLHYVANNVRNLIFPWVHVPHLASHTLAAISRRISFDWKAKYGHCIFLLETFVEKRRFRGICYNAAGWINVGETTGRGRNSVSGRATLPIKDIWLYPLKSNFRSKIK